ncbi:GrpB family protein [Brachybacterium sacelli]|uniref:GrpB-like predicted nucleotidyltransferase (UPF0157 family) n=1 Tax=Brachybacterium sacelli TaxID=173364 RepID=A0ABS4WZW8_9MICO|nr:GrpB family protein [Brachybacterium sacelli]MBP2381755.1 GrpB-like predicted nucleotidyltransferase (UPF0157 family) [Brachybacterium sacelli]
MPTRDQIIAFDDSPPPPGADPWVEPAVSEPIEIREHDPAWASCADEVGRQLRNALGGRALQVAHIGPTAVPGLPAKPLLDLDLTVADPDREQEWLPQLVAAGFRLTIREPWWYGHRMVALRAPAANVHVFGPDSPEPLRHLVFRDHLRRHDADRRLYGQVKRDAAAHANAAQELVMQYNARKEQVLRAVYARAFAAAGLLDDA